MLISFLKHWFKALLFIVGICVIAFFSIKAGEYIGGLIDAGNTEHFPFVITMGILVLIGTGGWAYESAKSDIRFRKYR